MLDAEQCNDVVYEAIKTKADYWSNTFPRRVDHGYDCEVFTFSMLMRASEFARSDYDREHVTPWMQKNGGYFFNWSIDTPEDLERVRKLMAEQQAA
jgi:spore coat polysaccharide biosynthesis protein SpsF (cytidylyltransferase family)